MRWYLGLIVIFGMSGLFAADTIKMNNGDILSGKITNISKEKIIIKTAYTDVIKLNPNQIKSIKTDTTLQIKFKNGDILTGKIVGIKKDKIVISTIHSGNINIKISELQEHKNKKNQKSKLISLKNKHKWNGDITIGGNYQTGNNEKSGINVGITAERETNIDRFSLNLQYHYAEDDKIKTTDNIYGAFKYDYFFAKRTYWYLSTEMLSDDFKDLELQTIAGGGLGYKLVQKEKIKLDIECGLAYKSNNYKIATDDSQLTTRLATKFEWKIFNWLLFKDHFIIYPDIEGDYQYRNEAVIEKDLGKNWALKLTNIVQYNSNPALNTEKTDTYWGLGLRYKF